MNNLHIRSVFLILIPGCFYLSTLAPSMGYRDTPEFVDTSFASGISHPAGFPAYNLIAKAITFLPLGSIAFRVNLFSTLLACITLVVIYLSAIEIIKICLPESSSESSIGTALFPPALLAFSSPFWFNSLIAEVYTLHYFFTVLIIHLGVRDKIYPNLGTIHNLTYVIGEVTLRMNASYQ